MRWLLAFLLALGCGLLVGRYVPHHADSNPFLALYMHLMPAPLVHPHGEGGGAGDHGAEADYLLALPLPGSLEFFATNKGSEHPVLAFTNLQAFQVLAILVVLVLFSGVAKYIRTGRGDSASRVLAGWVMWIRDEMVYPVMGRELGAKFLPYFLFVFFFIAAMNVLGLVPHSATATASIFVTCALALTTFAAMIVCGMVVQGPLKFWINLVPHVPLALWPLMFAVEVVGLLVKPAALMIRLFANMTGGHLVVLSLTGLIFALGAIAPAVGYGAAPLAVGFAVFIMIIESFVALLQAYIFTQLSIIFVNAAVHPEH